MKLHLFMMLLLLLAVSVAAQEYYVAPVGDDAAGGSMLAPFQSIQHALRLAQPGDTVTVRQGTYVIADYAQHLHLAQNRITLRAYPGEEPVIVSGGSRWGVVLTGDDLTFEGFTVRGFAIAVAFGRDTIQRNLVVRDVHVEQSGEGFSALYMPNHNNARPVLDGARFENISVTRPQGDLVIGLHCGSHPCNNVVIDGAHIDLAGMGSGSGADGIAMEYGDNILVDHSLIEHVAGDGIDFKASNVVVQNTKVMHTARNGVKFWRGGQLLNSIVFDTGADAAVVFDGAGAYRIVHSVVAHHNWQGPTSYTATVGYDNPGAISLEIVNSIFYQNVGSVWISPTVDLTVKNTIFAGGTQTGRYLDYNGAYGDRAQALTTLDASLLEVTDPGFVGLGQDFHLVPHSVAHNAGVLTAVRHDMDGLLRVDGQVDIGVYEHDVLTLLVEEDPVVPVEDVVPEVPAEQEDIEEDHVENDIFDDALALFHMPFSEQLGAGKFGSGLSIPMEVHHEYQTDGRYTLGFWFESPRRGGGTLLSIPSALRVQKAGRYLRFIWQDDELLIRYQPKIQINDNAWHHVALRSDGITVDVFLDGVLLKTLPAIGDFGEAISLNSFGGRHVFVGSLDEFILLDEPIVDVAMLLAEN